MEWIADGFSFSTSLTMNQQEAAKDAKQKAALSPEDSEESPMVLQVKKETNFGYGYDFCTARL